MSGPGSPAVKANVDSGRYRPSRQMCVFSFHAAAHALIIGALLLAGNAFADECRPSPIGKHPIVSSESVKQPHPDGTWSYWQCSDPYVVRFRVELLRHDHKPKLPDFTGLTLEQSFDALIAANRNKPYDDPSLASLRAAAEAHIAAHMPPLPKWAVAKNGTTTTRPVYGRNEDGTLGALVKGVRSPVGAECICSADGGRVVSGSSTYCAFGSEDPVRVTLCKPVP